MADAASPAPGDDEVHLFVERMALTFAEVGFPRMAARVLFTVMSADDPLTAAEIGERLGVSAAAVCGAVRYLTQFGMLVREPVKGSRRDRYRMPDNPWYEATVTKTGALQELHRHRPSAGVGRPERARPPRPASGWPRCATSSSSYRRRSTPSANAGGPGAPRPATAAPAIADRLHPGQEVLPQRACSSSSHRPVPGLRLVRRAAARWPRRPRR